MDTKEGILFAERSMAAEELSPKLSALACTEPCGVGIYEVPGWAGHVRLKSCGST